MGRDAHGLRSRGCSLSERSRARARSAALRALTAVLAPLLGGCADGDARAEAPRSALLITLDTTRLDALGCMGVHPGVTPNLDRLASEGVLFERAYSVAPLTLPAHASILTGLLPPRHTLRTNGGGRLPAAAQTLAERAAAAGFQTAAFVSSVVLARGYGLDQGFERYDAPPHARDARTSFYAERPAAETQRLALDWLASRDRARPFLLWVHLWDPHAPWDPPAELRGRTSSPYLDEVAAADQAVGELVEALRREGVLDDVVVLVVADHGEGLGEHGEESHGTLCYDTTLRVPLILRAAHGAAPAGARRAEVASVVDVAPTLLEAMGLSALDGLDGVSLLGGAAQERGAYFESWYGFLNYGWSPLVGWVDARGKYLHSAAPELYETRADPQERTDLAPAGADVARYREAIAGVLARPALASEPASGGASEALRALGYAAAGSAPAELPDPLAVSDLPAPAQRMQEHARLLRALELTNAGDFARAEPLWAAILADNPRNLEARESLAFCQLRLLRLEQALTSYRALEATGRASPRALTYLGVCLRATGDEEGALQAYARALEQDPDEVETLWQTIDLLDQQGRTQEAEAFRARWQELVGEAVGG